jgi:protease-4
MKTVSKLPQYLLAGLAVIGLVALLGGAVSLASSGVGAAALAAGLLIAYLLAFYLKRRVPERTIIELDLARGVVEQVPADSLGRLLAGRAYPLRDLVDALRRAGEDDRVVGLVARIDHVKLGVARAQELAAAVAGFAATGKPAVAYAETLGEIGTASLAEMAVAASFGEFYLQPASDLGLHGLRAVGPYLGTMFRKAGIEPSFDHRYEYKAAKYRLTEDHMPGPAREAAEAVVGGQFDQLVDAIAAGRDLDRTAVLAAVDRAPVLADEARAVGLVDGLLYRDQVMAAIDGGWGAGAKRMPIATYLKKAKRPHRRGAAIALIYGTGAVARGKSRLEPLTRALSMGSDDVSAAFRAAVADRKVKAIVFRIDSPGGSAVASETIWRETQAARAAGKPVIATMGDLAGSGGYYVAAGCDKIVAQPGTITGSIGVVFGKLVTRDAWARLGINVDGVAFGETSGFASGMADYTPAERERVDAILDTIYRDFVERVADGRGLDPDRVDELARGRIWSGLDAAANGLVDELGGLESAYELARRAASLDEFRVKLFPAPKSPLAQLLSKEDKALDITELIAVTEPLAQLAGQLHHTGPLSMPGFSTRL